MSTQEQLTEMINPRNDKMFTEDYSLFSATWEGTRINLVFMLFDYVYCLVPKIKNIVTLSISIDFLWTRGSTSFDQVIRYNQLVFSNFLLIPSSQN